MTTIKYQECKAFQKDVKRLSKKFKTLREDLETAKEYSIELFHRSKIDTQIVLLSGYPHEHLQLYKLRKFACRSLKGRGSKSGIRIVYAYDVTGNSVFFIEMYFKSEQTNESKERIEEFLKHWRW